jgi:hypothetical protein
MAPSPPPIARASRLAVGGRPPLPDTPPGYEAQSFSGLGVRAHPEAICDEVGPAAVATTKVPAFRERMTGMPAEVAGTGAGAFAIFLAASAPSGAS